MSISSPFPYLMAGGICMLEWSIGQLTRLLELGADENARLLTFADEDERDRAFQNIERLLVQQGREKLAKFQKTSERSLLAVLTENIATALAANGFVQFTTPTIISRSMLEKMSIGEDHYLNRQVFWIDEKKCLRPMMAPGLYEMMKIFPRYWSYPIRFFEVGSCFRKESQGAQHLNEFTMVNLVEMGTPLDDRNKQLKWMASLVLNASGLNDYEFVETDSEVYGDTLDVEINGIEVASGAFGPHKLDVNWGIDASWVGIGFGLERLLSIKHNTNNVHQVGRSNSYFNGVRLNI